MVYLSPKRVTSAPRPSSTPTLLYLYLPDEVQSYQDAVKFVVQSVTQLIGEQLIRQGGLEGGRSNKADIEQGQYVWTFRNEDDARKGILFGKVVSKQGSNYLVDICSLSELMLLPYQRIRVLPDVSPFPSKKSE